MSTTDSQAKADRQHRDPRAFASAEAPPRQAHVDPRAVNQGARKARAVPRHDTVVNWGRKAPHPKEP